MIYVPLLWVLMKEGISLTLNGLEVFKLTNIGLNSSVLVSSQKTLYFVIAKIENRVNCVIFMHFLFYLWSSRTGEISKYWWARTVTLSVRVCILNLWHAILLICKNCIPVITYQTELFRGGQKTFEADEIVRSFIYLSQEMYLIRFEKQSGVDVGLLVWLVRLTRDGRKAPPARNPIMCT